MTRITPAGEAFTALVLETFKVNGRLLATGDRMTRPVGQTSARWQVLGAIEHEALTVAAIARAMGLARQSVQRTADLLESEGMSRPHFLADFAHTIRRADRVQPALLVASIVSAVGLGLTAGGPARTVALMGAAGFMATLVASGTVLVPLQRRIVASSVQDDEPIEAMKHRWFRGHLARSFVAAASFTLVTVAAVM